MPGSTWRNKLPAGVALAFLLGIWILAARLVGKEIILPGPVSVLRALARLAAGREFWTHLSATLLRGLIGFILSYLAGVAVGVAAGLSGAFDLGFRPFLVAARSTPSMALILLALLWFRSDVVAVIVTWLMVFPLVTQNVLDGIKGLDPSLLEMARLFRVPRLRILRQLYLPAILPALAAAATAGLGLTWKVMISAEVLAAPRWGVGTRMDNARIFLNTPEVLAWTAVVVLIGLFCDRTLDAAVRRRLLPWK